MASHRGLKAWQHAKVLAVECGKAARAFPPEEQSALADQLRRAAYGIPLNIAEGAARASNRDYRKFLDLARASTKEVETIIEIARDSGFVSASQYARLEARCDEVAKTLYGLMRSVTRQIDSGELKRRL